jgi:hypothetical protein
MKTPWPPIIGKFDWTTGETRVLAETMIKAQHYIDSRATTTCSIIFLKNAHIRWHVYIIHLYKH